MRFFLLLPLLGLLACQGNTEERRAARGVNYVSEPSHYYFKNVRLRSYAETDLSEGVRAYVHADLTASTSALQPYILDHWYEDKATLHFRNGAGLDTYLPASSDPGAVAGAVRLVNRRREAPEQLLEPTTIADVQRLYNLLRSGADLYRVVNNDAVVPAFATPADREAATEVVGDYLKLIEAEG